MEEFEPQQDMPSFKQTGIIAGGISIALVLFIILQHNLSFQKSSQTIIPAGNTYLGPSKTDTIPQTETPAPVTDTPTPTESGKTKQATGKDITKDVSMNSQGKIIASQQAEWALVKGKRYPYAFSAPKALKLTTFPSDQFDIYAIVWENRPPDQNVLVGVDNLTRTDALKQYITLSKRSYVENWWKQFGGLKGVASIVEFTNSKGLKGYRAKFLNNANQTPNDDVFFEVADTKYVIHLASGILETSLFNKIIDSVEWNAK